MKTRQQSKMPLATRTNIPVLVGTKRPVQSPDKGPALKKRNAFGDITNALQKVTIQSAKKPVATKKPLKAQLKKTVSRLPEAEKDCANDTIQLSSGDSSFESATMSQEKPELRAALSQGSSSSDSDVDNVKEIISPEDDLTKAAAVEEVRKSTNDASAAQGTSQTVFTYDSENQFDPSNVPDYAHCIFEYYKTREDKFKVADYLPRQKDLTRQMRAILVDWMVEVQENFELNHETLYQAVKIVDIYLDKNPVARDKLQLVGSTAMFIACKFDERNPPLLDDFLYICDDAYNRDELMEMERTILITLDFDIGMPLSYRYVRRYAKATKASMETLTLARYILEASLMHYDFVFTSESLIAAAAFFLAIRMRDDGEWTPAHEYYSGFKVSDLTETVLQLNLMLRSPPPAKNIQTILNKYSHKVFFEVAKIPSLEDHLVTGACGKPQLLQALC